MFNIARRLQNFLKICVEKKSLDRVSWPDGCKRHGFHQQNAPFGFNAC